MTQQLENSWVSEIYTSEEMKQYIAFEQSVKSTPKKKDFDNSWDNLIAELEKNLNRDPESELGIQLGERCMLLINGMYGKKHAHLRTKMMEQGFGEGKGLTDTGLTRDTLAWLEKAILAYWKKRIYGILEYCGKLPSEDIMKLWNEVMDDMYGEEQDRKKELVKIALKDENISETAKQWLRDNC